MSPDFTILAVCSGNICRSPLIELLLRERMTAFGFGFASAGVIAQPGWRMPREAQATAVRLGVPSEVAATHVARRVDEAAILSADLVLTATREHRAAVIELVPKATKYTFAITEFERLIEAFDEATCHSISPYELVDRAHRARTLLRPLRPEADDLEDPITQPQEVHDRIGDQIAVLVDTIAHRLGGTHLVTDETDSGDAADATRAPIDLSFPRRGTRPRQSSSQDDSPIG